MFPYNASYEIAGFWLGFSGWLGLLASVAMTTRFKITDWIYGKFGEHWWILPLFLPIISAGMMMVGWDLYCRGNGGRYPGYPFH